MRQPDNTTDATAGAGQDKAGEAPLYPLFLKLEGRKVLVVGAGSVGIRKIRTLLDAGARVHVVDEKADGDVQSLAAGGALTLREGSFDPSELEGVQLVVAATNDRSVNETVVREAKAHGALVNVVDVPDLCDFYVPARVQRGRLQVAVSSDGCCPAFTRRVREMLEDVMGEEFGIFLKDLAGLRAELRQAFPRDEGRRKAVLTAVVRSDALEALQRGDRTAYEKRLTEWKSSS